MKITKATIEDLLNPEIIFEWEHGEVISLPIELIEPNDFNYNEMSPEEFNLLVDNLNEVGLIQPIIVVPILPKEENKIYKFKIIGGEHRFEAMRLADASAIKAVICDPEKFNEKEQMRQCARLNKIHGSPNKEKFKKFVEKMMVEHEITFDDMAAELGFVDQDEFHRMLEEARDSLPTEEAKKDFDNVKDEIKTVDELTLILNKLFTKYGDTVPYNYMIIDFGGKDHIWVRMLDKKDYKLVVDKAKECQGENITFDSFIRNLLLNVNVQAFIKNNKDKLEQPTESVEIDTLIEE